MNKTISSISLALIVGLTGCSLTHSDYERPQLAIVDSYQNAAEFLGNRVSDEFWTEFSDPKLNSVIEEALKANLDLQSAYLNVRKARYALDEIATNMLPDLAASGNIGTQRNLEHSVPSTKSSGTALTLSYELDLFGRLDAERLSSFENLQASAYDYWAMRLSTIASVANAYWQYAYAKEALALGQEDLKDSERRLALIKSKFDAGAANGLEYDTAMVNHLQVQETLEERAKNVELAHTALASLLGLTADKDVDISTLEDATVPNIELEIPSALLSRRPDLMASEAVLRKAYADYDVAALSLYPTFVLSSGINAGDTGTIGRFLSNPIGALGAAVTLPFLNYNELSARKGQAMTQKDMSELDFVNTYIQAVKEVSDSISNINYYKTLVANATKEYSLARQNYNRYSDRYRYGASSLNEFLDAADTLRSSSDKLLNAKRMILNSSMDLMIALGGDTQEEKIEDLLQNL